MAESRGSFDWNTWMWWITLTALGNTAAVILISMLVTLVGVPVFGATGDGASASLAQQAVLAPVFALAGAVVGLGQWIMLRGLMYRAGWWILASAGGWMAGYSWSILLFPPGSEMSSLISLLLPWILFGLATGLCQWLMLRHHFDCSARWIPVETLAMAVGASGWLIFGILGGFVMWLVAGAFNGFVLLRLPRKPTWPA